MSQSKHGSLRYWLPRETLKHAVKNDINVFPSVLTTTAPFNIASCYLFTTVLTTAAPFNIASCYLFITVLTTTAPFNIASCYLFTTVLTTAAPFNVASCNLFTTVPTTAAPFKIASCYYDWALAKVVSIWGQTRQFSRPASRSSDRRPSEFLTGYCGVNFYSIDIAFLPFDRTCDRMHVIKFLISSL